MRLWLCRLFCPSGYVVHPRRGPVLHQTMTGSSTVPTSTWTYWQDCA